MAEPNIQEALEQLQQKHVTAIAELKTYVEEQTHQLRTTGTADPEVTKSINVLRGQMADIQAEMRRPNPRLNADDRQSIGQKFIQSEDFKRFAGRPWHKGYCQLGGLNLWEGKTLIDSAALGDETPGILRSERLPGIVPLARRELRMRDLIPASGTTFPLVSFIRENVFTNAASPQTEGSAKAESANTFVVSSAEISTIAHWIPVTRQALDDLPGLRTFIDNNLMYGLKLKEETEILSGDNLGEHLNGLITQATAYAGTYNVAADTRIDRLNWAILELAVADEQATGIVLNPIDYHRILAVKTEDGGVANTGSYVVGDPLGGQLQVPTIWGIPVVKSNSITSGRFLVGNFQMCEIKDRQEAVIDLSTEYDDYFVKNKVAIRAEERMTLLVKRTTALITGTF